MAEFSKRLNYTFGNEDWHTEQKALQIRPDSRILCITASGDRPLNLLFNECRHVAAIDSNAIQNNLLHLKTAALKSLDYEDYLAFLGATPDPDRGKNFKTVLNELDVNSRAFWEAHTSKVMKGILYQGKIERLVKISSGAAKLFRPQKNKKLFQFDDLEKQKAFLQSEWDTCLFRKAIEIPLSPPFANLFAIDPGLHENLDQSMHVGVYLYNRMISWLNKNLAKKSILLSLVFQGKVGSAAFSPHLLPEGVQVIRKQLNRLSVHTEDVIEYLKKMPKHSFDRFSFSDIASYMPQDKFNELLTHVHRTASPGARFCFRQFTSYRYIPKNLEPYFEREPTLEKELEEEDNCFVYRFMTGRIKP